MIVDPSSLVFVAIIGVWAAYLVPQFLRRREQLAESRERDRDSAGVRVLAPRRRRLRPGHRASAGPVLGAAPRAAAGVAAGVAAGATATKQGSPPAARETPRAPASRPAGAVSPPRTVQQVVARAAARRRARVLLLLLAVNVGWWAAVAATALTWPAGLPVSLLLLADLVALRVAARHRARRVAPARPGRQARPTASSVPAPARPEVAAEAARPAAPAAEVLPGTWVPVPVPPPVYTLKPAVHRAEPAVRPPDRVASAAVREPMPVVEEAPPPLDLDAVLERRRAVNL